MIRRLLHFAPPPNYNRNKAIEWIKKNTLWNQGIAVSSKQRISYPEVTGYLIPTLLDSGKYNLAEQYSEFLCHVQQSNGAFLGPDGKEYIFDTGQVLRGLLKASKRCESFFPFALKTAEYIFNYIEKDGKIPTIYGREIPEYVNIFILPALVEAGQMFNKPEYIEKAQKSINYYKNIPDVINPAYLTHFLAYIIDGFIEMGEQEFVRACVEKIFASQNPDGAILAYPNVKWICSPGVAQFAVIWYKLGMYDKANKALDYLCKIQNSSGGFYGSYGKGANYFPDEEISWAVKFFLDAELLKEKCEI